MKNTILIVDDEPDIRETLCDVLEQKGFEVFSADCADTARRKIESHRIDAIICDVRMPEETGVQFLKSLRDSQNDVPFILMSGHGDLDTADAIRDGADAFFRKPFDILNMASALIELIGRDKKATNSVLVAAEISSVFSIEAARTM